jgi:hypothetical protein
MTELCSGGGRHIYEIGIVRLRECIKCGHPNNVSRDDIHAPAVESQLKAEALAVEPKINGHKGGDVNGSGV